MAQIVKKLEGGGTFLWNGETIKATDANIAKIAAISPEAALLAKSGHLESLNPDGTIVTNTKVKNRDKRKIRQNLTPLRLLSFSETPAEEGAKKKSGKYKLDVSKELNLSFDSEGKMLDTPDTRRFKSRILGYLNGWKGGKEYSDYDFGGRYNSIDDANSFWQSDETRNYFANQGEEFFNRIKSGEATEQDIVYLKAAGINYGGEGASGGKSDKKAMEALGLSKEDWKKAKNYITYDDTTGLYSLTPEAMQAVGANSSGGFEFNDNFIKKMNNPRWSWLKNLSLVGGNLYKTKNGEQYSEALASWLANSGYNGKLNSDAIGDANNIYKTLWTDNDINAANVKTWNPNWMHDWFNGVGQGVKYNVLTGVKKGQSWYADPSNKTQVNPWDDSHQIIKYWKTGEDGNKVEGYAVFDKNGKHIGYTDSVMDDARQTWKDLYMSNDPETTGAFQAINAPDPNDPMHKYHGMVQFAAESDYGTKSGIRLYVDPNNKERVYIDLGWDGKGASEGKAYVLPPEIAPYFAENADTIVQAIATNPRLIRRLSRSLNDMVTSNWGEMWDWSNRADASDYENMGFDAQAADRIDKFIRAYGNLSVSDDAADSMAELGVTELKGLKGAKTAAPGWRQANWLVPRYQQFDVAAPVAAPVAEDKTAAKKTGGIIRAQAGAKIVRVNEVEDLNKAFGLGEKDSRTMSGADWADLTALITDIAGTALAFVPGANIASAITGAAGSAAGLGADISRDGFQWGDLGRFAVNLGLDVATLIPFAGGAAKLGKVGKAIKNAAPLLIKGAAALGLSDAVINTVKKIASGESFTINDARRIVQGFSGGLTLHRTGLNTPGKVKTEMVDANSLTLKSKNNSIGNVRLNKQELESVRKMSADKQKEKLAEIVLNHVKKSNKNTTLTKDNILDAFDVPTKTGRGELSWDPRKWVSQEIQLQKKVNTPYDYKANTRTDRNWYTGWFYGDTPQRMEFNRYLRTGKPVVDVNTPVRSASGTFNKRSFMPTFFTPGFTSANGETDPHTFADVHVVVNKKGGKVKKYENGAEMESDEEVLYNQMNFDVNVDYDKDATDAEKVALTEQADKENQEYAKQHPFGNSITPKKDKISPETTWQKIAGHINPELAGNLASLGLNIAQNKTLSDAQLDVAKNTALSKLNANRPAQIGMSSFDNSLAERQHAEAQQQIYAPTIQSTDPNIMRAMKKDQTTAGLANDANFYNNTAQGYSAYKSDLSKRQDAIAESEQNFSNLAGELGFGLMASKASADAATKVATNQSIDNFIKGATGSLESARKEALQQQNAIALETEKINFQNEITTKWNDLVKSGEIDKETYDQYKGDIAQYFRDNDASWYTNAENNYRAKAAGSQKSYNIFGSMYGKDINLPTVIKASAYPDEGVTTTEVKRRGGKLSVEDQLWLEKNRDATKTVAKLRADVLKLLKSGK